MVIRLPRQFAVRKPTSFVRWIQIITICLSADCKTFQNHKLFGITKKTVFSPTLRDQQLIIAFHSLATPFLDYIKLNKCLDKWSLILCNILCKFVKFLTKFSFIADIDNGQQTLWQQSGCNICIRRPFNRLTCPELRQRIGENASYGLVVLGTIQMQHRLRKRSG